MKAKFTMSLVMMIGSVLLFIGVTFAWFIYRDYVETPGTTHIVVNVDASAGLEVSPDGVEFDTSQSVATQNRFPGDVVFYRLVLQNTGNTDINVRVRFSGFDLGVNNPLKDDTNFQEGRNLLQVTLLNASNSKNSDTIEDGVMENLIGPLPPGMTYAQASLILFNSISIPVGDSVIIIFTFSMPPTVGNNYQNLNLSVNSIVVDAVIE